MITIDVPTRSRAEMVDITRRVQEAVTASGLGDGTCSIHVPHTTAGVTINEGADPDVAEDILETLERLVPTRGSYRHAEGNSAAHVKASLVGSSAQVIIDGGTLQLGTWQAIFFCEFDGPRSRKVNLNLY